MSIRVTIHGTGIGVCSLAGREGDGLTVTFEDGTIQEGFLNWKSFRQLCSMKLPVISTKPTSVAEPAKPAGHPMTTE